MTSIPDLSDLISLSLLPPWTWRDAAERLRAGATAATVLAELLDRRARAAIRRATEGGLTPLPWSDRSYPAALAAIADLPFVLWIRGAAAALERPAVALVGSRAASIQRRITARCRTPDPPSWCSGRVPTSCIRRSTRPWRARSKLPALS